jgi:hypothetical protein
LTERLGEVACGLATLTEHLNDANAAFKQTD